MWAACEKLVIQKQALRLLELGIEKDTVFTSLPRVMQRSVTAVQSVTMFCSFKERLETGMRFTWLDRRVHIPLTVVRR
jgi:hypothetical protein